MDHSAYWLCGGVCNHTFGGNGDGDSHRTASKYGSRKEKQREDTEQKVTAMWSCSENAGPTPGAVACQGNWRQAVAGPWCLGEGALRIEPFGNSSSRLPHAVDTGSSSIAAN